MAKFSRRRGRLGRRRSSRGGKRRSLRTYHIARGGVRL